MRHHNQILFHLDSFEIKAQWLYSENHLWCNPPPFQWILLPLLASANILFQSLLTAHAHRWREKHWSTCYSTALSSRAVLSLKWGRSREVWVPRVSQGKLLLSLFRLTAVLKTPGMRSTSTTSPCVGQRNNAPSWNQASGGLITWDPASGGQTPAAEAVGFWCLEDQVEVKCSPTIYKFLILRHFQNNNFIFGHLFYCGCLLSFLTRCH